MNPRQHSVALLEFTRKISNDILNGIPDDKLTHQPSPTDNHALWAMGHLAATDAEGNRSEPAVVRVTVEPPPRPSPR